ncbi:transporter substrate-binding domain-containing protein [Mesorhizobium sp.]|uniref:transporter substrate-binding domain-containing protein n=1 Tax=Mesorhizobium sp. TaxID=1871066 RepID=UPI00121EC8AE|nr:transporter substrate-binding domain-containing protein [Mesorhizobium sp.]TIV55928.1 MAG: transporter substrate-binding domain-containing protein [Mesorhizobium sp.]
MGRIATSIVAATLAITSVASYGTSAMAGEVLERVLAAKTLKIAVGTDWGPISSLNEKHELVGFDVDVAKAIARFLGVKAEFVTPGWDVIAAGNWGNRWDLSMGQATPTKERAEKFNFTTNYFFERQVVVVHNTSKYSTPSDINGKTVGVGSGTLAEQYANHTLTPNWLGAEPFDYKFKAGDVKVYTSTNVAFDDLRLGDGIRLNAVITDSTIAQTAIKAGYPFKTIGALLSAPGAIMTMKGDQEFTDKISAAIKSMQNDGTLSELSKQWYGSDHSAE